MTFQRRASARCPSSPGVLRWLVVLAAWLLALSMTGLTACSGAERTGFRPLPEPFTRATVAGPLCDSRIEGQMCQCVTPGTDIDAPVHDADVPDTPGTKRYQFKLGPASNEMWVTVDDMVLYKGVERATECFILDVRKGKHEVVIRAKGDTGFAAGLTVNELGKHGIYDTFTFHCGGPDACTFDSLQEFKESLDRYPRGVHDPCGATRIRTPRWISGDSDDRVHPSDLQVQFTLDVYDFAPRHPPGDPACKDKY